MEARFLYAGFSDLLADAAFQHQRAAKCTEPYEINRHVGAPHHRSVLWPLAKDFQGKWYQDLNK